MKITDQQTSPIKAHVCHVNLSTAPQKKTIFQNDAPLSVERARKDDSLLFKFLVLIKVARLPRSLAKRASCARRLTDSPTTVPKSDTDSGTNRSVISRCNLTVHFSNNGSDEK